MYAHRTRQGELLRPVARRRAARAASQPVREFIGS